MKFFFSVFFLAAGCGLSAGIIREYSYHYDTSVKWKQAQWRCRNYYRDLATVTTSEEHQRLVGIGNNDVSGWIGLYRTDVAQNTWNWSDGEQVSFLNWQDGWPKTDPGSQACSCAALYNGYWYNDDCGWTHSFYCYRFLILVNERKTWEEALQYCKTYYTGLASLPNDTQLFQAKMELELTQTVNVWTGLRFMNGQWFWVSGEPLGTMVSLPSCPAQPYRCGALNTVTNVWENRDCNENLNFLCWR